MKDLKTIIEAHLNESIGRVLFTVNDVNLADEYSKDDVNEWKEIGLFISYKNTPNGFLGVFKCYTITAIRLAAKLASEASGEDGENIDWTFLEDYWPGITEAANANKEPVFVFDDIDVGDYFSIDKLNDLAKRGVIVKYNFGQNKYGHLTLDMLCLDKKSVKVAYEVVCKMYDEDPNDEDYLNEEWPEVKEFIK